MKRLVSIFASILFLVSVFSVALAADTAIVTKPAGTKGDTVRLRQKPNGTILINIPFGKEVKVLDEQGEWTKISYNSRTGWMKSEFLSLNDSDAGLLSFDVTGDWYEWYTVDDLLAYQDISSQEKRWDIDYLLAENMLFPSDGRIRSIQLNSHGRYIYDNWTEYEVFISGNNELCIYDGYDEDSVQIASLSFVDKDTMWYWGSNEYVAVYKRTKPVNDAPANAYTSNNDSKVIERVLNRKIFEFKEDMPEAYITGIDIRQSIAYMEDWTFGRILNEDTFETLNWEVHEITNQVKMVNCSGILHANGFINHIGIEFYVQEGATVPLAWSITVKNQESNSELSLQDMLDEGMETGLATIYNDASIAKLLTVTYLASDVYVEKETESVYSQYKTASAATMKQYEGTGDTWGCFRIYEITPDGKLFFEVDWYRLAGFGGVATICNGQAVFDASYSNDVMRGTITLSDNTLTLKLEESFSAVAPGEYTYEYDSEIYRETTAAGAGELNHDMFLNFLNTTYDEDSITWEFMGSPYEMFSLPGEEYGDTFDLYRVNHSNGDIKYYACYPYDYKPEYGVYNVSTDGILSLRWSPTPEMTNPIIPQIPYGKFGSVVANVIDKYHKNDSKYALRNLHGDNQYFVTGDYGYNGWAHVTGATADGIISQIICEQNNWYSHGTSDVKQRVKDLLAPVTVFWGDSDINTKTLVNHIYDNLKLYYEVASYDKQAIETEYSFYEDGIEVYVFITDIRYSGAERITIKVFAQIPSEKKYYEFKKPKPNR